MKLKQSTYKNFTFDEVVFPEHSKLRIQERFNMSLNDILKVKQYFKCGGKDCRYKVVRNKLQSYSSQKAFYNEKLNMLFMVCVNTKEGKTTLYLDGSEGYSFMR